MRASYEVAGGSITGTDHLWRGDLLIGKNNQDAYVVREKDGVMVAVVCDGCGSKSHSEVGAQLGARIVANEVLHAATRGQEINWKSVREKVLTELLFVARTLAGGGSLGEVIAHYLLFTVNGVVIRPRSDDRSPQDLVADEVVFFRIGDGFRVINGVVREFVSPLPNEPAYLAYGLRPALCAYRDMPEALEFETCSFEVRDIESFVLASDGLKSLLAAIAAGRKLPGRDAPVGDLAALWTNDFNFSNADAINRKLRLMNSRAVIVDAPRRRIVTEEGILTDDTTVVVGRRKTSGIWPSASAPDATGVAPDTTGSAPDATRSAPDTTIIGSSGIGPSARAPDATGGGS